MSATETSIIDILEEGPGKGPRKDQMQRGGAVRKGRRKVEGKGPWRGEGHPRGPREHAHECQNRNAPAIEGLCARRRVSIHHALSPERDRVNRVENASDRLVWVACSDVQAANHAQNPPWAF